MNQNRKFLSWGYKKPMQGACNKEMELVLGNGTVMVWDLHFIVLSLSMDRLWLDSLNLVMVTLFLTEHQTTDKDVLEDLVLCKTRTVNYRIERLRYRGPLIWKLIPDDMKISKSLQSIKNDIRYWKPEGCK